MKKLFFAVMAVAMASVASAAKDYGVECVGWVRKYSADKTGMKEGEGYYSLYFMKQADARAAMGTSKTVTYQTVATWLSENFAENRASVIGNAQKASYDFYSGPTYTFGVDGDPDLDGGLSTAIGVYFFDDGQKAAYNVMASASDYEFEFDVDSSLSSGWTAAAIPEPTSGLLLLIGVAGLALRRRRA